MPYRNQFYSGQVLPAAETPASCSAAAADDASEGGTESEQVELEQPDLMPEPLDSKKGTFKDFNLDAIRYETIKYHFWQIF